VACQSVYAIPNATRNHQEEKSLDPYRESLLDVLREGLRTETLREPAVRGSVALVEIPGFLGREEVEDLVRGLNEIVVHDANAEMRCVSSLSVVNCAYRERSSRTSAVEGLTAICKTHSAVIEASTLPLLFHNLPDQPPPLEAIEGREKYRSVLLSLSELCVQPSLFETLVIRITTKLDLLSSQPLTIHTAASQGDVEMNGSSGEDSRECYLAYAWDLLNCLSNVINAKLTAKHTDVVKYFDTIIPRLYELVVSAAVPKVGDGQPLFRDRRLLGIIGRITERLMWELDTALVSPTLPLISPDSRRRQGKQLAAVYAAFEKGEVSGIVRDANRVKGISGSPLRVSTGICS
jgi:DNA repair/transcription protein MET18/MMS19